MDIDTILKEWEADCAIDDNNLDRSSIVAAKLHAKYIRLLVNSKFVLKSLESKMAILKKTKHLWFAGKLTQQEMKTLGWKYDPFDGGNKPLKSDMDIYFSSDPDIIEMDERILGAKTTVDVLNEILQTLKWRHQSIRNVIDWKKFQAGN